MCARDEFGRRAARCKRRACRTSRSASEGRPSTLPLTMTTRPRPPLASVRPSVPQASVALQRLTSPAAVSLELAQPGKSPIAADALGPVVPASAHLVQPQPTARRPLARPMPTPSPLSAPPLEPGPPRPSLRVRPGTSSHVRVPGSHGASSRGGSRARADPPSSCLPSRPASWPTAPLQAYEPPQTISLDELDSSFQLSEYLDVLVQRGDRVRDLVRLPLEGADGDGGEGWEVDENLVSSPLPPLVLLKTSADALFVPCHRSVALRALAVSCQPPLRPSAGTRHVNLTTPLSPDSSLPSRLPRDLTPLVISLLEVCTPATCPSMTAGHWNYLCSVHPGTPRVRPFGRRVLRAAASRRDRRSAR